MEYALITAALLPVFLIFLFAFRAVFGRLYQNMSAPQVIIAGAILVGTGSSLLSTLISTMFKHEGIVLLLALILLGSGAIFMAKEFK